jgi:hypothetical protein
MKDVMLKMPYLLSHCYVSNVLIYLTLICFFWFIVAGSRGEIVLLA